MHCGFEGRAIRGTVGVGRFDARFTATLRAYRETMEADAAGPRPQEAEGGDSTAGVARIPVDDGSSTLAPEAHGENKDEGDEGSSSGPLERSVLSVSTQVEVNFKAGLGKGACGREENGGRDALCASLQVPPPFSVFPALVLAPAGSTILRAVLDGMLVSFAKLLVKDYLRWAGGSRDKAAAAGSLVPEGTRPAEVQADGEARPPPRGDGPVVEAEVLPDDFDVDQEIARNNQRRQGRPFP